MLLFNTLGQYLNLATMLLMSDKGLRGAIRYQLARECTIKVLHMMGNGSVLVTQQSASANKDLKRSNVVKPTCYSMNFCLRSRSYST